MGRGLKQLAASLRLGASLALPGAGGMGKAAEAIGGLRGLAQKLGQTLSMVLDDLPPDARDQLSKLLGQSKGRPWAEVAPIIREDLGENAFASIEELPFAAASLGQVHRARLHTGEAVAVKVQYPDILAAMDSDLRRITRMTSVIDKLASGVEEMVTELSSTLRNELDYVQEGEALVRFGRALAGDLRVPVLYRKKSSKRVLTTELVNAPTLLQLGDPVQRKLAADRLVRAVYGPVLREGLLHGDTHPGNFLMSEEALIVLDFGCVRQLSPAHRSLMWLLLMSDADPTEALRETGYHFPEGEVGTEMKRLLVGALRGDFTSMKAMSAIKRQHPFAMTKVRMPAEAVIVLRSLVVGMSATLKRLDPTIDVRATLHQDPSLRTLDGVSSSRSRPG